MQNKASRVEHTRAPNPRRLEVAPSENMKVITPESPLMVSGLLSLIRRGFSVLNIEAVFLIGFDLKCTIGVFTFPNAGS